jgi:site-specific recombinase
MRAGPHEALKQIADGDRVGGLEALVTALRDFEARDAGSGVEALCHLLGAYPPLRTSLRTALRELLGDGTAPALYAEAGILANSGFFTELMRRVLGRLLPAPRDQALRGQFGALFESGNDADWLTRLCADDGLRILRALGMDEDEPSAWLPARNAVLDAIDLLSVRVAAIGVEPELLRHYRVPRSHNNPFLAQNAVIQTWLAAARLGETQADTAEADVLLAQCGDVMDRIGRSARSGGASLSLTFLLRRLQQSLARMRTLLNLAVHQDAAAHESRRVAFAVELALAEGNDHNVREHLRASTELVAILTTESASRTGEHYITETRSEYFAMFRSAMGAGAIIGVMAMLKMGIGALHLPPLIEALSFGLNYAAGFVLIYILHFTIATKQPAMTAQTIAANLSHGRRADANAISLLVSRVMRTQVIAVAGNLLLAAPVALIATLLLVFATGSGIPAHKAPYLLAELHPLFSPALFHAAIAGVWLFVAGVVSGYVDNIATYERLADRVRRMGWLLRTAGLARRERFAVWIEENIGGIAGNVFFGFALGLTGFVGAILGLPLDIRHITFAAANFSIAMVGEGFALPAGTVLVAMLGVLLVGLVNLAVSFALALWVALSARGQTIQNSAEVIAAIARRFRASPRSFFWPPKAERRGSSEPPPP